uniref:Ig-like domain-containing protein n=1 Tax=Seriola dumerili TaxID=41447 RepID=A0A3B4VMV7_SERDU
RFYRSTHTCLSVCLSVCLSAGVFLVCPEGGVGLELMPSASKVLLNSTSSFTVVSNTCLSPQVCSGLFLQNRGSSSVLQLFNVTWRNSGRYTCEEGSSYQSREIDIFIPGKGDNIYHIWLCEAEEDTIPCVVSDPRLNVSLYERPGWTLVTGTTYEPGRGFTGRLNDTSYVCLAALGGEERESQVYYVFSIVGELMRLG